MRRAIFIAATLLMASGAQAEEKTIVDACLKAAEHQIMVALTASKVQEFPELSPPRVRMEVSGESRASEDLIAALLDSRSATKEPRMHNYGVVMCEFENGAAPFSLTKFDCAGTACFISNQRLEELRVLLEREGY